MCAFYVDLVTVPVCQTSKRISLSPWKKKKKKRKKLNCTLYITHKNTCRERNTHTHTCWGFYNVDNCLDNTSCCCVPCYIHFNSVCSPGLLFFQTSRFHFDSDCIHRDKKAGKICYFSISFSVLKESMQKEWMSTTITLWMVLPSGDDPHYGCVDHRLTIQVWNIYLK